MYDSNIVREKDMVRRLVMTVYEIITNKIVDLLELGVVPWKMPWDSKMPMNLVSGKEYRGINIMLLSFTGFSSPYWLSFKQAQGLGGSVKAGAKGFPVVGSLMVIAVPTPFLVCEESPATSSSVGMRTWKALFGISWLCHSWLQKKNSAPSNSA